MPQSNTQNKKRSAEDAFGERPAKMESPFMPMFEGFKSELDEHHDRRERIIKASRDITATSKKIIFGLQRVRNMKQPIPGAITKSNQPLWDLISKAYSSISTDLQGLNTYRYSKQITGGTQEFMEALSFQHYLEAQSLVSLQEASRSTADLGGPNNPILLSEADYLLGVFDMTGELMRFAITVMATSGEVPSAKLEVEGEQSHRNVLTDLRDVRDFLKAVDVPHYSSLNKDMNKKMEVLETCVVKVENALYGLTVRGAERPKGWLPDEKMVGRDEVVGH
ncbi:Translin [Microthyrium microscopicum]|uniref:Translin n=1 Tax=Microthyrium microscopicum TaxID=703497 RepID=A0A6A6U7U0_9PEZI|nr:Translin [Microthyrium microscopicum]